MAGYQTGYGTRTEVDPLSPQGLRSDNRQQLLADLLRNAKGAPETLLTMGTSLADMAGTGLGTMAGMAKQKLSGEDVDLGAATDTLQEGKFTYQPRSEGGQETLRGLGEVTAPLEKGAQWAGQKTADVTGSPAAGAGVYTALNMADPEMLGPAAAKVAALRAGQRVARGAAQTAVPMGEALRGVPKGQRGAYTLEDLSGTEGDFSFQSPTIQAFGRLKPQEQGRVTGKQLGKALMREGAKKEELSWMGLDDIINSDEIVSAADVRKLAEANAPEFDFASARSGTAGGELDDEAISERARTLAYEDGDLEYPIAVYRGTGRHREHVDTFDTQREADRHIRELRESYVDDNLDSETEYQLSENLESAFDEEELAAMTDAEKHAWAEEQARESLESSMDEIEYETEADYDADPHNIDDLTEYWENQIRENPGDYNIEGGSTSAPAHGQYTVGRKGRDDDYNYTVSTGRLAAESRYGKNRPVGEEPEFLKPYLHAAEQPELLGSPDQMALFAPSQEGSMTPSKAFQIEALRRTAREADPNIEMFREEVDKSHFDELGKDQMYFTRETDRPAPEWGSVQSGIGRVPGSKLKGPKGEELPQREGNSYPMRLVEETQSDWLQAGRKTGWADKKGLEKIAKEDAESLAGEATERERVEEFQRQALSEMPTALTDDRINGFIENMRSQVAQASQTGGEMPYYADGIEEKLRRFEEMNRRNPAAYSLEDRADSGRQLFRAIYNAADSGSPTEAFADQLADSLARLPTVTQSPVSNTPTPSAPMRETRQYTQLSMADALRRAVQEGQQYLAWTPGDVHTKRWGTDTFQYAPSPENPRIIRYSGYDTSSNTAEGRTGLENLQASADELLTNDTASTIDLDDPNIDAVLEKIVKDQLNYGMHEYRKPDVQRKKRAAALKKDLEAAAKAAQAGERKAAHYSPRAVGYDLAYEPTAEDIIAVLRRAGVTKLPEIRDIPNNDSPKPLRGFEIDPEVAQAAKRGLPLPY